MRKALPLFLAFVIFFNSNLASFAQLGSFAGSHTASVSGQVGEYYLNLYGWISPFASIVLTSDGIVLRAVTADQNGNFSISDVLIKAGFSHFCLDAVDYKRLGESYTCFNIPPATGSVTMRDIFLPPTLGLSRTEIAAGASVTAFGYTMPGALVTLHLSNGTTLTTYADSSGYYQFTISGLKAGKYQLFATAEYHKKPSLKPSKTLSLHALSWWEQFLVFLKDLWNKLLLFLTQLSLGPLWVVIPILILIIILILKLWPEKFTFITESRAAIFYFDLFKRNKKPLHHQWFMGY